MTSHDRPRPHWSLRVVGAALRVFPGVVAVLSGAALITALAGLAAVRLVPAASAPVAALTMLLAALFVAGRRRNARRRRAATG
ncbi:hypothetical protein ACQEU5_23470 [Marinactinospora thermotolerans]|uniref:Uncharacterized protein n=1 Tax=Marinactinospora thermotolerans DSM 45154 TaxID=1122192 RepID=A0A1T4K4H1_9ACTN|nr:hypothetical protein [Marinactinospora thermotolerans]SJZ37309.1 hypothetical protein SAMN02745673_00158 [Marinactinospora thermotolerans DSM 45154]